MRKNNLHILLFIFCFSVFVGGITNADAADKDCSLKKGPTKEVTKYITELNNNLSQLKSKASQPGCGTAKANLSKIANDSIRLYNNTSTV